MHKSPTQSDASERFAIYGQVGHPSFVVWIERHAKRLGLCGRSLHQTDGCVSLILTGPPDLLDAMEAGCSLGPYDIWVDTIERQAANLLPANPAALDVD